MKKTVRIFTALLLLCLTLTAVLLPAAADYSHYSHDSHDSHYSHDSIVGTTSAEAGWQLSEDGETLTGCGVTFTRYYLPAGFGLHPASVYVFTDSDPEVTVNAEGKLTIAYLENDEVYVTDAARAELDTLTTNPAHWYLGRARKSTHFVHISELGDMGNYPACLFLDGGEAVEVPVGKLKNASGWVIYGYDSTRTVYAGAAALYNDGNDWLYVDYATLGNDRFDADGNVSLRSGTIPCIRLNAAGCKAVDDILANKIYVEMITEYENMQKPNPPELRTPLVVMFWIVYVLVGFGLPVVPLVLGLVFANRAKWGKPRRWYLISILAGVWMLLSLVLILLLIL